MTRQFEWKPSELHTVGCPECACHQHAVVLARPDGLSIVRCAQCTLTFVFPQPTIEALGRFYERSYFGGQSDFHRGRNYFTDRQSQIDAGTLTGISLLEGVGVKGMRVVEVGAADGALLAWCRRQGALDVTGIEFSEEAAAWGRAAYGITILHGNLHQSAVRSHSVDLVVAIDLIEHLQSPRSLIAAAAQWLVPGGRLAVICPNGQALNVWGRSWIGVQGHWEHLTYLARVQFVNWAHELGFVLEKHGYGGCPLRPAEYQGEGTRLARWTREPHKAAYNSLLKAATALMPRSALHEQSIVLRRT